MTLGELISGLEIRPPTRARWESVRVCDLTEDSRTVLPGSLFVARRGLKADGKKFAADAVAGGAVAVLTDDESVRELERGPEGVPVAVTPAIAPCTALLAERFYGHPTRSRIAVAAVTGTNGKTTTTFLIWQMLNTVGVRCGLIGTVIVDDGVSVGPAVMTTPPAIELSRTMSVMGDAGCRAAVIEASSHALDQHRVDGLAIQVGVFTNLTGDHLDYHRTMESYAAAKARLFAMLPADGVAIVNADDPAAEAMIDRCRAPVVRTSALDPPSAPVRAEILRSTLDGMSLRLGGPWGSIDAGVPLIGPYNAMNVAQALAVCWAWAPKLLGRAMTPGELGTALRRISAPPGRLEPVRAERSGGGATRRTAPQPRVFVDYAHTDDALGNVLTAVRGVIAPPTKLWVVFGAGGDKDRTKRPRMGLAAATIADRVVVTSDNPRSEKPSGIVNEILGGVPASERGKVDVQVDRAAAIRHAVLACGPDDVIVIAGKGHETEQVILGDDGKLKTIEFDDRRVAAGALAERLAGGKEPTPGTSAGVAPGSRQNEAAASER